MHFELEIDVGCLDAEDADDLAKVSAAFERLSMRRRTEIRVEGLFVESKLAWKLATLQQSLLYRAITLVRGVVLVWNAKNYLTSILAARALIETVVLIEDLKSRLAVALSARDIDGIDRLIMQLTFSTRDQQWLNEYPDSRATNIQTLMQKLDKKTLPGVEDHYNSLSERCHPNSRGHFGMFASLDKTTKVVTFSDVSNSDSSRVAIMPALVLVLYLESSMDWFDEAVSTTAGLQRRLNPI